MTDEIAAFIDNIADDEVPVPTTGLANAAVDKPMVVAIEPVKEPAPVPPPVENNGVAVINQPALPRAKMSPKQRLVADAMELFPTRTKTELTKMKMAELKELVANSKLINDTAKISLKPREELERMTTPELKRELGETVNANLQSIIKKEPVQLPQQVMIGGLPNEDIRANTLYNFHRVAAGIIECVSESEAIQARTGSNLAGLSQDLKDDKDEFMAILKDVYREHHAEIDMYITPLTVYGMFMMERIGNRYAENKKKISRGESVKSPLKLESLLGLPSQSSLPSNSTSLAE